VVIPNAGLLTGSVIVNTAFDKRRLEYAVGIGYGDDIETARRIMLETVRGVPGVLSEPAPDVLAFDLAGSSVNLRLRWWVAPPRKTDTLASRDAVLTAVKQALTAAGIDLPFPTTPPHGGPIVAFTSAMNRHPDPTPPLLTERSFIAATLHDPLTMRATQPPGPTPTPTPSPQPPPPLSPHQPVPSAPAPPKVPMPTYEDPPPVKPVAGLLNPEREEPGPRRLPAASNFAYRNGATL